MNLCLAAPGRQSESLIMLKRREGERWEGPNRPTDRPTDVARAHYSQIWSKQMDYFRNQTPKGRRRHEFRRDVRTSKAIERLPSK